MITYIPIDQLYPHWDNPRKDLGDLSELAESIKARGVMQNLTVVPGHRFTSEEYSAIAMQYRNNPTEELRQIINGHHSKEGYTVVIGHRRLAASKKAGLTELPCVISDMDHKTQVGTMLLENMQRSDLTVYEQAKGFQMMLDLGDTVPIIAEQTGFSETTVRKRVKLLELDETDFRESQKRNVSLEEYGKLNKIEDVKLRNTVLKDIGTNNFDMSLQRALDVQKRAKKMAVLVEKVKNFATEIKGAGGKKYIRSYYDYDGIDTPKDAGVIKYYYTLTNYGAINLYCDQTDMETSDEQAEKKQEEDKRIEDLKEETKRAQTLRENFIKNLTDAEIKKHQATAIRYLVLALSSNYSKVSGEIMKLMGVVDLKEFRDDLRARPERYLVACTYNIMETMHGSYTSWRGDHEKNEDLDTLYEFLKELGYEMSDDEKALQDGTHELFIKD